MRRQELFDFAHEIGVKVINAKSKDDNQKIAIHLLNPNLDALEDALCVAERDQFSMIVIHSNETWGAKLDLPISRKSINS